MSRKETTERGLVKALTQRDLFVLAFGAMIGWGWIILSGQWIDEGGPLGAISAFVIRGTLVIFLWALLGVGLFALSSPGRALAG